MTIALLLLYALLARAADFDPTQFAPELRLHSKEKFKPADPAAVFRAAVPSSLASEFPIRIVPSTPKAPWLWQKSGSRIVDLLPQTSRWELIDYWYFVPYNEANLWFGLGDHEGDWEGVALLFENEKLTAAYYSQHKGGKWYCERDLERTQDGRVVVYSSLGSHASYPHPGEHRRAPFFVGKDLTDAGESIAMTVRALAQEPYLNFEGRWGQKKWLPWNNGPIAPHPERKFLPRQIKIEEADWLKENCLKK